MNEAIDTDNTSAAANATALLALWNDVDAALDESYEDWHRHEHVPERLTVPGMLWALRWRRIGAHAAMPLYLTLYGLRDAQVLDSAAYQRLLAEPTPASRAMRPALHNLARWVCTLDAYAGIQHFRNFQRLALRTAARDAPWPVPPQPGADGALLLATRIPEAAALPWMSGGQSMPIEGDRIEGWAYADSLPVGDEWRNAIHYARLRVGP